MIVTGQITQSGEPAAFSVAYISNKNGDNIRNLGARADDSGRFKIDTSKALLDDYITFAFAGSKKTVPLSNIRCYKSTCRYDVDLHSSALKPVEVVYKPKNEKSKKNTLRNIILISAPLLLIAGIVIYKTRK